MKSKLYLLIGLLLPSFSANAQKIGGRVMDGNNGIEQATVSLLRLKDTSLVKISVTGKGGEFFFEGVTGGILLKVTSVGYKNYLSGPINMTTENITMPVVIQLQPDLQLMQEVKITFAKPLLEYRGEKLIVNLDAAPSNAGSNLLEAIGKIPGVHVDGAGNITIKGKSGVLIMLDGKETYLSGDDLASLLRSMPASGYDQVEVISNPSAKYDAATTGGIINIKSKKSLKQGFNGGFTMSPGIRLFRDSNKKVSTNNFIRNSLNWNYRKNGINIFGNVGYVYNNYFENFNENRFFVNNGQSAGSLSNSNYYRTPSDFYQFRIGLDYNIGQKSILGFIVSDNYTTKTSVNSSSAAIYNPDNSLNSIMLGYAQNPGSHIFNSNYNINYKYAAGKDNAELTADVSYISNRNADDDNIQSYFFDPMMNPTNSLLLKQNTNYDFDVYVGKADYTRNIGKWKMETGAKVSYTKSSSNQVFLRDGVNGYQNDQALTNDFLYREDINALYLRVSGKLNKLEIQAGLRAEQTLGNGHQLAGDSSFNRNRSDLFPSVFLNYQATDQYSLSLNYSRKITRPSFRNLNPFVFVTDSLYSYRGNPFLLPQFSQNIQFSQLFFKKFNFELDYYHLDKIITNIVENDPITKVTSGYIENLNNYDEFSIAATAPFDAAKWWNVTLFAQWVSNKYSGVEESYAINLHSKYFTGSLTNIFIISSLYSADANISYSTRFLSSLIYFSEPVDYSIGVKRKSNDKRGSIGLSMNSPFFLGTREGTAAYGDVNYNQHASFASQFYSISLNYKFGKSTVTEQRNKKNATEEEQRRL